MPRDLFGDVVVRPAASRSRRSPLFLLSLGAHGAALLLGVVGSLVATGALPSPRRIAVAYQDAIVTVPAADIELPSTQRPVHSPRRATSPTSATAVSVPAPVDAPTRIAPENPDFDSGATSGADLARVERNGQPGLSSLVEGTQRPAPPAPTPLPKPTTAAVRLHSGIRAPQKIFNVDPAYPPIARGAHVEGVVILEATIDTSGTVTGLRVLRPVALLDQSAVDAVRQWRFTPALLNGDPVAVIMTITVRFTLGA